MKRFIVVAVTTVGCAASAPQAHITASWAFEDLATHATRTCPTGFDTAMVTSQPVDATLSFVGAPFQDVFDCDALVGTTAGLPASRLEVWVEIHQTNETGPLYARSAGAFVDVTTLDKPVALPTILDDGGYFQLGWVLVAASNGAAVTCTKAGASGGIEVTWTDVANSSNTASYIFNCDQSVTPDIGQGGGFTPGVLAGTYTVSVVALDGTMQPLGSAATTSSSIQPHNVITNLDTVTIPITGL